MYSVYTMLLLIEWQFGIYMANWYMSNVYSRFSKRIGGGSFPVPFLKNHVYTVSDSLYTVSDHVYTVLSHVYTRLSENATGKLPPPIRLLYLLYTLLIYQFAMYIPNCHSMRNSIVYTEYRPVRRAYNVVVYAKF